MQVGARTPLVRPCVVTEGTLTPGPAARAGNEWTLHQLGTVMLCGMCVAVTPVFFKLLVHDQYALGAASDAYATAATPSDAATAPPKFNGRAAATAAAAATTSAATCTPPDHLGANSNVESDRRHSREHGRGRPSLPVILSGVELRMDASRQADDALHGRDSSAGAAAAGAVGADRASCEVPDPAAASSGGCGATNGGVEEWLHATNGATDASPAGPPSEGYSAAGRDEEGDVREPLLGVGDGGSGGAAAGVDGGPAHARGAAAWAWWPEALVLGPAWVPYMIFSADLMSGLASGMTIKFFPIFFMEKVRRGSARCSAHLRTDCRPAGAASLRCRGLPRCWL